VRAAAKVLVWRMARIERRPAARPYRRLTRR
jgi:hypothetical protein